MCDLVLLYLLPKREFYKNMKFKYTDSNTHAQVRPCTAALLQYHCKHGGGQQRVWGVSAKAGTDLLSQIRPALVPCGLGLHVQQQAEATAACLFAQHPSNRSVSRKVVQNCHEAVLETDEITSE